MKLIEKYALNEALLQLLAIIIFSAFSAFPAMLLWNYYLVPAVDILNEITWLQCWGIYILFNIFFKVSLHLNK